MFVFYSDALGYEKGFLSPHGPDFGFYRNTIFGKQILTTGFLIWFMVY